MGSADDIEAVAAAFAAAGIALPRERLQAHVGSLRYIAAAGRRLAEAAESEVAPWAVSGDD